MRTRGGRGRRKGGGVDVLGNKREGADVVFFAPVLMMRGIHDMVFDASDGKVNCEIKYAKRLCN